jgi:flagellar hook protein FlgE
MSFSNALSGLAAANNSLTVIGNNISNANTIGFKESRTEFADVYTNSVVGTSKVQAGSGVRVAQVAQQFTQGSVDLTGNNLDLAINGDGFFTLANNPADLKSPSVYSRAGAFMVNKDGIVTNSEGQALLAYKPNGNTIAQGFSAGVLTPISLSASTGLPTSTTTVDMRINLDASNKAITTPFNPLDSTTYTKETSVTVYDSLGVSHKLTSYFSANTVTPPTRDWTVHHYITDDPANPISVDNGTPATLTFDSTGKLTAPANGQVALAPFSTGTSAASITATINYSNSTQFAAPFSVDSLNQNGVAAGKLTSVSVDADGIIFARYSNGASSPLGKVALTRFTNPQGLTKLGDNTWAENSASGGPIPGNAGEGKFGAIQAGALEQSNVDLSKQLVNLIIAQQTYQANSQTIQTEKSVTDQIMNLR